MSGRVIDRYIQQPRCNLKVWKARQSLPFKPNSTTDSTTTRLQTQVFTDGKKAEVSRSKEQRTKSKNRSALLSWRFTPVTCRCARWLQRLRFPFTVTLMWITAQRCGRRLLEHIHRVALGVVIVVWVIERRSSNHFSPSHLSTSGQSLGASLRSKHSEVTAGRLREDKPLFIHILQLCCHSKACSYKSRLALLKSLPPFPLIVPNIILIAVSHPPDPFSLLAPSGLTLSTAAACQPW